MITTLNPYTQTPLNTYELMSDHDIEHSLQAAHHAFGQWKKTTIDYRTDVIKRVAKRLELEKAALAERITLEMGKPIAQAVAEIDKTIWLCTHFSHHAEDYLVAEDIATQEGKASIHHRPLGVILGLMPWNFPVWQTFRFAIPALLAGNTVCLRLADNVTGCAKAIAQLFKEETALTIFHSLVINHEQAARVIKHATIRGVAFTGSEQVGRIIGQACGNALKPHVLELGGSDPFIIRHDADLAQATAACVQSRLLNTGQVCISPKRIIVDHRLHDDFIKRLQRTLGSYQYGDPRIDTTQIGPLASQNAVTQLNSQVQKSIQAGATAWQHQIKDIDLDSDSCMHAGNVYPITVLTDVTPTMPAFQEELFGPVFSILRSKSDCQSIELANAHKYGLGAAIYTAAPELALATFAPHLDAGMCFINKPVSSSPLLPFGGVKASGYGKESGKAGIRTFTNHQVVHT